MENEFTIIDRYFDGECSKEEEIILFTTLSQNEKAREYFKSLNKLKEVSGSMANIFPETLDAKILTSIQQKIIKEDNSVRNTKSSRIFYFAAAAIILVGLLIGFKEIDNYKENLKITTSKIEKQEKLINLILNNSLPAAEINTSYEKEVIIISEL